MKRLFIALNLPSEIKEKVSEIKENLEEDFGRGVRWVKNDNLHITVSFLGPVKEKKINELIELLSDVDVERINIELNKIRYVPDRRRAKLIWIKGTEKGLKKLKEDIDNKLVESGILNYEPEKRDFILHVTLGRIKSFEYKKIPLEEIPLLEDDPYFQFSVDSFELMESKLGKGGPKYKIIKSYK